MWPSPSMRSCPTAVRARCSRVTARSTGSACRDSTVRPCSAGCSTQEPAICSSVRPMPRRSPSAGTCPKHWWSRPRGLVRADSCRWWTPWPSGRTSGAMTWAATPPGCCCGGSAAWQAPLLSEWSGLHARSSGSSTPSCTSSRADSEVTAARQSCNCRRTSRSPWTVRRLPRMSSCWRGKSWLSPWRRPAPGKSRPRCGQPRRSDSASTRPKQPGPAGRSCISATRARCATWCTRAGWSSKA